MKQLDTIRAVMLDLDGTLVHTAPDFLIALNLMRAELSLPAIEIETVMRLVGKGTENLIQAVLALDFSSEQIDLYFPSALAAYQRHYWQINGDYSELYPDVLSGLSALRDLGLRLACVTNKPLSFSNDLLRKKGLNPFFEIVYGGDSFPNKKPHPQALHQVCADFDLAPSQVLMIGDSCNDALAARAAGCPVWILPYGYNHGEAVQTIESDGIVESLMIAAQKLRNDRLS